MLLVPDARVSATVLGRLIVQAGRVFDAPFGQVLDRYALTRNAWWLLTELYRTRDEPEATIGEHARRCALAPSSATIAAEQLTSRRLTRRRRPKDNRRVTYVTITPAGVDLVHTARADLEKAVSVLYDLYDTNERQVLHDLLVRTVSADLFEPLQ